MQLALLAITLSLVALSKQEELQPRKKSRGVIWPLPITSVELTTPCDCLSWTDWINADANETDAGGVNLGDFETIGYKVTDEGGMPGRVTKFLAIEGIICNNPAKVECRKAYTTDTWQSVEDDTIFPKNLNCDSEAGFICRDSQQQDGQCHDYEVRLMCWKPCEQLKWTDFEDEDNPGGNCDCEHPGWADHTTRNNPPCPDGGTPLDIDCRFLNGTHAALTNNIGVTCNINKGLTCKGIEQLGSPPCGDYKVRYLCGDPLS